MKRTIKEVYDLIKEKRDNAENGLYEAYGGEKYMLLKGQIDAYNDIICLIENSQLLESESD